MAKPQITVSKDQLTKLLVRNDVNDEKTTAIINFSKKEFMKNV